MIKKKIPGDKLLLFLSIVFLVVSIIVLYGTYEKMKIKAKGEIVIVKVKQAPENCSIINSNWDGYCRLEYKDKYYVVRAGKKFCSLVSGRENVEMLISEDRNKIIFLEEYESSEFGGGLFIFLVALFAVYSSIKSLRLHHD
ncbi:hypothetical protein [Tenacibaculum halocynthiae]|uniref:hypothetical protein n=1 Tax=Tenacibaculum halocynthiae TaxID=1254437 RepID=UPI00389364DA